MITVYEVLLPQGLSPQVISAIGTHVSTYFKTIYTKDLPAGDIPDCGLIVQIEGNIRNVVNGYPNAFRSHILKTAEIYLSRKAEAQKQPEIDPQPKVVKSLCCNEITFTDPGPGSPVKRDRKRIPAVPKPIFRSR